MSKEQPAGFDKWEDMENTVRIADRVHWVGMNDRVSPLFESIWPLPNGVSYNSYLILDRKAALLENSIWNVLGLSLRVESDTA